MAAAESYWFYFNIIIAFAETAGDQWGMQADRHVRIAYLGFCWSTPLPNVQGGKEVQSVWV